MAKAVLLLSLMVFVFMAMLTLNVSAAASIPLGATDVTLDEGATGIVEIRLGSAPNGLAGFDIVVSIPGIITVDSVEFPVSFSLNEVRDVTLSTMRLRAVDFGEGVQAGATDILLATLHIQSASRGEGLISITVTRMDGDDGFNITTTAADSTVTVNRIFPTFPDQSGRSQDLDGDGLVDDLNANNRMDFADLVIFFWHLDSPQVQDNIDLFDYSGNGSADMADVVGMFNHLIQ